MLVKMLLHVWVRYLSLMSIAALFILQQVRHPLVTIWVAFGEYLHCVSYILLLDLIFSNRGLRGISVKTQICFLFVHWFRYLDSFFNTHLNHWIMSLKFFYMLASATLILSLICLRSTWERKKDTCSLFVLLFISILLGTINFLVDGLWPASASECTFHYFWIVSHYVQGFAMLPQFVFCYRDPDNKDPLLTTYVVVLSSYRLAYAVNWIERAYKERFFYVSGPLGLGILLIFLGDFVLYKLRNRSCISSFVLRIDDTVAVSPQPLLQAVYGANYERLSPADASSSAQMPPVEIDLQRVHVVGRVCRDSGLVFSNAGENAHVAAAALEGQQRQLQAAIASNSFEQQQQQVSNSSSGSKLSVVSVSVNENDKFLSAGMSAAANWLEEEDADDSTNAAASPADGAALYKLENDAADEEFHDGGADLDSLTGRTSRPPDVILLQIDPQQEQQESNGGGAAAMPIAVADQQQ